MVFAGLANTATAWGLLFWNVLDCKGLEITSFLWNNPYLLKRKTKACFLFKDTERKLCSFVLQLIGLFPDCLVSVELSQSLSLRPCVHNSQIRLVHLRGQLSTQIPEYETTTQVSQSYSTKTICHWWMTQYILKNISSEEATSQQVTMTNTLPLIAEG